MQLGRGDQNPYTNFVGISLQLSQAVFLFWRLRTAVLLGLFTLFEVFCMLQTNMPIEQTNLYPAPL